MNTIPDKDQSSETDHLLPKSNINDGNRSNPNSFAIQASDVIANDYLHERAKAVQDIEANMTELVPIFEMSIMYREVYLNVYLQ